MAVVITTSTDELTYNKIKNSGYKVSSLIRLGLYHIENCNKNLDVLKKQIDELRYDYDKIIKSRNEIAQLTLKIIQMCEKANIVKDGTVINGMEVEKWKILLNQFLSLSKK
ncbi:MAG: hypothetical protein QXO29_07670 [Nitrososphaerota archaeon]